MEIASLVLAAFLLLLLVAGFGWMRAKKKDYKLIAMNATIDP